MRSSFFRPFLLICGALFLLHQLSQKVMGWSIPPADNYLDTLVCMPLLLTGFQAEQRWLWGRRDLRPLEVIGITALLSFAFEGVFPLLNPAFTADWVDVAAYFSGAFSWLALSGSNGEDLESPSD